MLIAGEFGIIFLLEIYLKFVNDSRFLRFWSTVSGLTLVIWTKIDVLKCSFEMEVLS